jgi:hypothetical protein
MTDDDRRRALLALSLAAPDGRTDAELAPAFGSYEEASLALSRLSGYVLQLLAMHRDETVADTTRFVRHMIGRA